MTGRDAFIRAILEDPADDTKRLAFADYLAETGKAKDAARAEFIRNQITLAAFPETTRKAAAAIERVAPLSDLLPHVQLEGGTPEVRAAVAAELKRFADLRSRGAAILKKWGAGWLPKPLRPGYPGLAVEGDTVWVDPLGGYVRFERGLIAQVGIELPWRPDEVTAAAARFAGRARLLFAANPLARVSVSFEGHAAVLEAEVRNGRNDFGLRKGWGIGWSLQTLTTWRHDASAEALAVGTRAELGRRIPEWLSQALSAPASAVAIDRQAEDIEDEIGGHHDYDDEDDPIRHEYPYGGLDDVA